MPATAPPDAPAAAGPGSRATMPAVALVLLVLAVANLLNNGLAVPAYVLTSVLAAALLLLIHRRAGGTAEQAGLGRAALPRGLRWAATLVAVVALVYLLGAALPATRVLFLDGRVDPAPAAAVAFQVLVRIPLGTVLLEEIGFRGVLYGLIDRRYGPTRATAVSCAAFGLWHAPPAVRLVEANPALAPAGIAAAVTLAVLGAAVAGLLLTELRRRSGSLLAPAGLHWATNALGYLTAIMVRGGG